MSTLQAPQVEGVALRGPLGPQHLEILTAEALAFVAELARGFTGRIQGLLEARRQQQAALDQGQRLDFLSETAHVREGDWVVAPLPQGLQRRAVEITGPADRKMIINALNSGADVFMADLEDSLSPTWDNVVLGQLHLRDAVRGTIDYVHPTRGTTYKLNARHAALLVRPRGLHLPELHMLVDGEPVPGALFDFGLYFFHNAQALLDKGAGPWFYLPKLEHHLEARLWNEVFVHAQERLGLPQGSVKATVLIETLPAAFQMDEILYELRQHSAGLNCGRWDYIFSFIKKHRMKPEAVMPDRSQVGMTQHCMASYTRLVIKTCHRRGAHAMGGMAAQIPINGMPEANKAALAKVRADKLREVRDGHDGTWVAHPALVSVAREIFDRHMQGPHQIHRERQDVQIQASDLLAVPTGTRTLEGLRLNLRVGVQYLEAWLRGQGCVPLYHLMEDAATAEISRTQVWQWLQHGATLEGGQRVTLELIEATMDQELEGIAQALGDQFDPESFARARRLFMQVATAPEFVEFLTSPAYREVLSVEQS